VKGFYFGLPTIQHNKELKPAPTGCNLAFRFHINELLLLSIVKRMTLPQDPKNSQADLPLVQAVPEEDVVSNSSLRSAGPIDESGNGLHHGMQSSHAIGEESDPPHPPRATADDEDITERLALLEEKVEQVLNNRTTESHDDDKEENFPRRRRGSTSARRRSSVPIRGTFITKMNSLGALEDDGSYLPESTFSLLITEEQCSAAFIFAIFTVLLSMTSLIISLVYVLMLGDEGNPLNLPVNVNPLVRGAQYLGVIIGVLMEDEIPQGLELMAISARTSFVLNDKYVIHKRVIFSSALRLIIGYMFLIALFVNVVQSDDVLSVFFDVLALQFLESIDDVAFNLGKRGFWGTAIMDATQKSNSIQAADNERGIASLSWSHILARVVYYFNAIALLLGLVIVNVKQSEGAYRCNTMTVTFEEITLEEAFVYNAPSDEPWLLIYSHFNGIYKEDGKVNGYPRYTERNKNDGSPYELGGKTTGAEFVYCPDIKSWVFRHENIRTSQQRDQKNECDWLARSPETEEYDLLSVAESEWSVWTGRVEPMSFDIKCNECTETSDCNYHGDCKEASCECYDDYFGENCEFEWPCSSFRSKIGDGCDVLSLESDGAQFRQIYGRPIYTSHDITWSSTNEVSLAFLLGRRSNLDASGSLEFVHNFTEGLIVGANYSVILHYSGSRWHGTVMPSSSMGNFKDSNYLSYYHGFWQKSFDRQRTFLLSEVSYDGSPEVCDFFQMPQGSKGEKIGHGPYGMLVPLTDVEGSGFFTCLSENGCYDDLGDEANDSIHARGNRTTQ